MQATTPDSIEFEEPAGVPAIEPGPFVEPGPARQSPADFSTRTGSQRNDAGSTGSGPQHRNIVFVMVAEGNSGAVATVLAPANVK